MPLATIHPAFPVPERARAEGITALDYFAAAFGQAYIMRLPADANKDDIAKCAYDLASLFIQESRRRDNLGTRS